MNDRKEILNKFDKFLNVIASLRDPKTGCPWDREQTLDTMKDFFLEECYELRHELEKGDHQKAADELGDITLLVSLCAQIASENNHFDMGDVLDAITEKLIERHPHVFGDVTVKDSDDVTKKWDDIKRKKSRKNIGDDLLMSLPPMLWAYKVQKKLANIGFDFKNADETLFKVKEEFREMMEAVKSSDKTKIENEMGDLFFSMINLARHLSINPEAALISTISKFIDRVKFIEGNSEKHYGRTFKELSMPEMDNLWELSKKTKVMEEHKK